MTEEVRTKDFSKVRPRIVLTVDGEQYEAKPALSLPTLQAVQAMQKRMKDPDADRIAEFEGMFTVLLKADDAARFAVKLKDSDDPIDPSQLGEMVSWLMEQYGGRPTEGSLESPSGSTDATSGMPSTDGV
jgi:hypothetical protein